MNFEYNLAASNAPLSRSRALAVLRNGWDVMVRGFPMGGGMIAVKGRHPLSGECLVDTGGCGQGQVRNVVSNRMAAVLEHASGLAADAETVTPLCGAKVTDPEPSFPGAPLEWACAVEASVEHDEHEAYSEDGTVVRTWPAKKAS